MENKKPYWTPRRSAGFLLDWDGVIADTKLDFSGLRKKYFNGEPVMLLEDGTKLDAHTRDAFFKELIDLEMAGAKNAVIVDGAHELLEWLNREKIPYCILSRNCIEVIQCCAKTIGVALPEHTFTRDNMPFVKPDPRALFAAAKAMGVRATECLYVGDFLYDLQGARRAGMRAVLVERDNDDWHKWADVIYPHVKDFVNDLISPRQLVPWEYRAVASKKGEEFIEKAASITLAVPDKASPTVDCWIARAAELGVINFYVDEKRIFTPEDWKANPSFSPEWMGRRWIDAVADFLAIRFPLARATADGTNAVNAPKNSLDLMRFVERKKN